MSAPGLASARRVLIVKLSSMGDIVHVTPCLRALRRACPRAEIVMAVEERFAAVVAGNPHVDLLIRAARARRRFLPELLAASRALTGRFDIALDFQGTWRSAAWMYASRARWKGGRGRWRPGWQSVKRPDLRRHAIEVCAEVAPFPVENLDPEIFLSPDDEAFAQKLLHDHALTAGEFVILNPFTTWPSKAWSLENYTTLAHRIRDQLGQRVVITGGPGETFEPPGAVSFAGQLTLGQSLALYKSARLMITGDTGPMHAAAALGTRVVALFGPTLPERTGPWGGGHIVIQEMRPPHHYTYRHDPGARHMRAIDLETVFTAVASVLSVPSVPPKL